jgi:hypothetical protein
MEGKRMATHTPDYRGVNPDAHLGPNPAYDWYSFDRYMAARAARRLLVLNLLLTAYGLFVTLAFGVAWRVDGGFMSLAVFLNLLANGLTTLILWTLANALWGTGRKSPYVAVVIGILGLLGDVLHVAATLFVWKLPWDLNMTGANIAVSLFIPFFAVYEFQLTWYAFRIIIYSGDVCLDVFGKHVPGWQDALRAAGGPFRPVAVDVMQAQQRQREFRRFERRRTAEAWCAAVIVLVASLSLLTGIVGSFTTSKLPGPPAPPPPPGLMSHGLTPLPSGDLYDPANGLPAAERAVLRRYLSTLATSLPPGALDDLDEVLRRHGKALVARMPVVQGEERKVLASPPVKTLGSWLYIFFQKGAVNLQGNGQIYVSTDDHRNFAYQKGVQLTDDQTECILPIAALESLIATLRSQQSPRPSELQLAALFDMCAITPVTFSDGGSRPTLTLTPVSADESLVEVVGEPLGRRALGHVFDDGTWCRGTDYGTVRAYRVAQSAPRPLADLALYRSFIPPAACFFAGLALANAVFRRPVSPSIDHSAAAPPGRSHVWLVVAAVTITVCLLVAAATNVSMAWPLSSPLAFVDIYIYAILLTAVFLLPAAAFYLVPSQGPPGFVGGHGDGPTPFGDGLSLLDRLSIDPEPSERP